MENVGAITQMLGKNRKLPTLPGIAVRILDAVQKERPDLQEIAEILSTDPPLSAEILKLINSPFFGLPRKVTSVFHAVSMLGMDVVKNMALSFVLIKRFSGDEQKDFDYPRFWKYSLTTAIAAHAIAETVFRDKAEDAFFLGLLHDMGRLALMQCLPDQYRLVAAETASGTCCGHQAEHQVLGFDHMAVGARLVQSWGLPDRFWQPMACHHCPDRLVTTDRDIQDLSQILHLAVLYAEMDESEDAARHLAMIDRSTKGYGYQKVLDVDRVAKRIFEKAKRIFPCFDIAFADEADYYDTIDRARAELINVSGDFMDQLLAQQRQIDALRREAAIDGMTQLMNYQHFHVTLHREMARSRRGQTPLTLVMADIDHFKRVNDTYGHLAGDHAIKTIALHLKANLRETDHIARYGGEEFAIILYHMPPEEVLKVMERVRAALSEVTMVFKDQSFKLSMSFGIATMTPDDAMDKEDLISCADKALYKAKSSGRNCCRTYGDDAELIVFPKRRLAAAG